MTFFLVNSGEVSSFFILNNYFVLIFWTITLIWRLITSWTDHLAGSVGRDEVGLRSSQSCFKLLEESESTARSNAASLLLIKDSETR